jgi:hypothetical protein
MMMTINFSPNQFGDFGLGSHTSSLQNKLDAPKSKATLRQLIHVLCPPSDSPRLLDILKGAMLSIRHYERTLISPNESFLKIMSLVEDLVSEAQIILDLNEKVAEGILSIDD